MLYFVYYNNSCQIHISGCRFPGDVICGPANQAAPVTDSNTYRMCVLATENKNLWKKPTMTVTQPIFCQYSTDQGPTVVLSEFCNNNDLLLTHAGLMRSSEEDFLSNYHHRKYAFVINPCITTSQSVP